MEKKHRDGEGLSRRWFKSSIIIVALTLIVIVAVFFTFITGFYYKTMRTSLESKARTATDFFENYITKTYAEYYDSVYRYAQTFTDANKLELQFIDENGRIVISTNSITAGTAPGTVDVKDALETGKISSYIGDSSAGERVMAVSAPMMYSDSQIIGVMRYVTSMKLVDRQILLSMLAALGIAVVVVLIVVLLNLVFIRSVIEPVGQITRTARRIADGSYGIQIEKTYPDEIGEMVSSINEMSMKIAQSERIQTEFISSVSHELRTPLTAITGWGETLMYNENLDSETCRGIQIILREARRLTKMVEELLEFTRMEDGRFTLNVDQIDVAVELEDAIYMYRDLLRQDEMDIEYEPYMEDMPLIPADASRLRQVFLNVFDNAAKYARDGKKLHVSVNVDSDYVIIAIRDYGPGVPEDELENVKMKFYKGSNAKERGSGIGLAVCDEIVRYHGGEFTLSNAEGGGLCVTIKLPKTSG